MHDARVISVYTRLLLRRSGLLQKELPVMTNTLLLGWLQLPIYYPSEEEKKDPKLYASNVRELMLREGGFKPSESSLQDCRAYIAMLEGRKVPANSQAGQALGLQQTNGAAQPAAKPEKHAATPPSVNPVEDSVASVAAKKDI